MRTLFVWLSICCFVTTVACSDDNPPADDVDSGPVESDPDASAPLDEFVTLVEGEWTMAPGSEGYQCVYATIQETVWVTGFEPIAPVGTHHTVVSIGAPERADGVYPCEAGTNYPVFVQGSGVGTGAYELPPGVAVKLEQGQQMLLNLHLFNFTEDQMSGVSGVKVKTIPESEVVHEAQSVLAGVYQFEIPPKTEHKETGFCTMAGDTTVVSVFPHMHMLGKHMKVTAHSSTQGSVVVHDLDYSFDDQIIYGFDGVEMKQGDRLEIECTWDNTLDEPVGFGDSSLDEMCFIVSYRYPPVGPTFCVN